MFTASHGRALIAIGLFTASSAFCQFTGPSHEQHAGDARAIQAVTSFVVNAGVSGITIRSVRVENSVSSSAAHGAERLVSRAKRPQELQVELTGDYADQKLWLNEMLARYPRLGLVHWEMQRQEAGPLQGRFTLRLLLEPQP